MIIINSIGSEKATIRLMHFLQASRFFDFDPKAKIIKTVYDKTNATFRLVMIDENCFTDTSCDTGSFKYYKRWMVLERVLLFAGFSTLRVVKNSKHILAVNLELPFAEELQATEWNEYNIGHDSSLMLNIENEKVIFTGEKEILKILEFYGNSKRLDDGTILTIRKEGGFKVFLSFNPKEHIPIHYASKSTVLKIFPLETVSIIKFKKS